jgi:acyl-CoA reductase-like NAD-dependent aldehyde dehydrogenase
MNALTAEFARQQEAGRFAVHNPATQGIIGTLPNLGANQITEAVARAAAAHPGWAASSVRDRMRILERFAELLCDQKDSIARVISREAGKPEAEAMSTEILVVLDTVKYLQNHVPAFLKPEPVPHGNPIMKLKRGTLLREPFGVIGIISPWNYPFSLPTIQTLTALVTGNAVALKPSEFTPYSSLELARLLKEAGLDPDLLQVITGDGAAGAALLAANVQKVVFTGSVATGKRVAQAAAARLLPVVLELGGKDPMIVLEDADIDVASSAAVWGAFMNAGQTCLSVERCYVQEKVYPTFLEKCVEKTEKLRVGSSYIDSSSHPLRHDQPGEDKTSSPQRMGHPQSSSSHSLRHEQPGEDKAYSPKRMGHPQSSSSHPLPHQEVGEGEIRDGAKDGAPVSRVSSAGEGTSTPKHAKSAHVGDPDACGPDPEVDLGPMIHERQLRIVQSHVDEALARGARLLAGGKAMPQLGPNFFTPTILADVDHSMQIMREETFGPVLPVCSFKTEDEAVALANDSEYGLAASIFTRDRKRGEALARRIQAGTVMVNDVLTCFGISEAPHGGIKASGIGRTHGRFGLEEMVWPKYVDSDRVPRMKKLWWYGYGPAFGQQMGGFIELLFAKKLINRLRGGVKSTKSYLRRRLL